MNWEALGAIGEMVAAGGVIFSLVYLAVQIRNQSKESRLGAINALTAVYISGMDARYSTEEDDYDE